MKKLTTICAFALVCLSTMAAPKYLVQATWEGTEPTWDASVATATGATIVDLAKLAEPQTLSQWMAATGKANEIWIIAGTYHWTEPVTGSLNLYGGFAGTETSLEQRAKKEGGAAWEFANETVITGADGDGNASTALNQNTGQVCNYDGITFTKFTSTSTSSDNHYGGIGRLHGNSTVKKCQFIDISNSGNSFGVFGVYNGTDDVVIENCLFKDCAGIGTTGSNGQGGVISYKDNDGTHTLSVLNCKFVDCYATQTNSCGGAIFVGKGKANIQNNIFEGCYGYGHGTVLCLASGHSKIYNNLIISTTDRGDVTKALLFLQTDSVEVINNTILNKTANNGTSLLYINGKALVMNNIINGTQYCPKAVAGTAALDEKNNIFITDGNVNMTGITAENNLFLKTENMGQAIDIDGVPTSRIAKFGADVSGYGIIKDLRGIKRENYTPGCYEFIGSTPSFLVQATWEGTEPKWDEAVAVATGAEIVDLAKLDPQPTLSQWMAATGKANEVWIIAGIYSWTEPVTGFLNLYGGFAGTETSLEQRAKKEGGAAWEFANETVITGADGDGNASTVLNQNTGQVCNYDGITFTKFASTATSSDNHFGGIGRLHGNASVKNCQFIDISNDGTGGVFGSYNGGNTVIENCLFQNCVNGGATTKQTGGALTLKGSSAATTFLVRGCKFVNCSATHTSNCGGAVFVGKGTATIENNIFEDCYGQGNGTSLVVSPDAGTPGYVYNNLFITTTDKGDLTKAPLFVSCDTSNIIHNTIVNRMEDKSVSVLHVIGKSLVANNIINGTQYCPNAKDGSIPMYEKNNIFATDANVVMLGIVEENNWIVPAAAIDSMLTEDYMPKVNIANRAADASDYDVVKDLKGIKRVNKTIGCYEYVGDVLPLVGSVSLNQTELNVQLGETATLVATITPENAALLSTAWKSQFDTVATVVDGVITPVAEGVTTITVTVDGLYKATCTVTVVGAAIDPDDQWIFVRNGVLNSWGTICLERDITGIDGATFWNVIAERETEFEIEQVIEPQAGYGYLIRFTANELKVQYGTEVAATPVEATEAHPIQGTFVDLNPDGEGNNTALEGNYIVYQNQLCKVGKWVALGAHRAYVVAEKAPSEAPEVAKGPRMTMPKPSEVPTLLGDRIQKNTEYRKVLKDGQLYIRKGDKTYTIMGIEE